MSTSIDAPVELIEALETLVINSDFSAPELGCEAGTLADLLKKGQQTLENEDRLFQLEGLISELNEWVDRVDPYTCIDQRTYVIGLAECLRSLTKTLEQETVLEDGSYPLKYFEEEFWRMSPSDLFLQDFKMQVKLLEQLAAPELSVPSRGAMMCRYGTGGYE